MARRGKGEGTIVKRADGRWEGRIDLGYIEGKRVRKSVYGRTRREVQEKLARIVADLQRGLPVLDERTTLAEFLERWLEAVRTRVRPATYRSYEQTVRNHVVPALGSIALAKLQPHHVQSLVASRLERGLSPRTADYCRVVLRAALHDAMKWGLVARNVAALADPPRRERPQLHVWDVGEARRFLAAARGDRLEALAVVALALGLRQGEALGLRWDAAPRPPARGAAGPSCKGNDWNLMFTTSVGTPLYPKNVRAWFRRLCLRAGVRPIRFHDLRHTCATLVLAQDIPPRVVQELRGHSQVPLTSDTYTSVLPRHLAASVRRMDEVLAVDHHPDRQTGQTLGDGRGG